MEILEMLLSPVFDLVFGSKKVNKWAKTALFLAVALIIPVVLLCLDIAGLTDYGKYIIYSIVCIWVIGSIIAAIWGHKNNWKKW